MAAPHSADAGLWFLNTHVRVLLSGDDNEDGISLLEHRMPCGMAPPLHLHHDEDEIFHILEGAIRFDVGGELRTAAAGDTLVAPAGVPHGFRVVSPEGARVLTITRGGFQAMVEEVATPAPAAVLPEDKEPSSAMQAALAASCKAQGIDLLGPPIA